MSNDKKISRRAVLRGVGGAAVTLPLLEVMGSPRIARAAGGTPKRYVVCCAGSSLGAGGESINDYYVPSKTGREYDLKRALEPFAAHANPNPIRDEISVVTGLKIPWARANGGVVPAGGRPDNHHETMVGPLVAGVRMPEGKTTTSYGPSSDQIVADAIKGDTPFPSLQYRVQVSSYIGDNGGSSRGAISYRGGKFEGGMEQAQRLMPLVSPQQAYKDLFFNFVPGDSAGLARQQYELSRRKSVLDLVRERSARLLPQLGQADKQRMSDHFDQIRELERRLASIAPDEEGACRKPDDPGRDPAIGGDRSVDGDGLSPFDAGASYSDEETRAQTWTQLIHMAFACDLTRVVSLQFTYFHSWMNMKPLIDANSDLHEIGHGQGNTPIMAKALAWHYKHFAKLVQLLRDTPEGDGSMLDSSVLVMLHEGGYGLDASDNSQNRSHSTENMSVLIAGRAGGLKPGQHVRAVGKHPANVLASAMKGLGLPDRLGEVQGHLPELFT